MDKTGFLQENGQINSSMRLMCFISLLSSVGFGCMTLLTPQSDSSIGLFITMGFLLGAFAPKALQKMVESKLK